MWLLLLILFVALIIGVPVAAALGLSSIVYMVVFTNMNLSLVASSFFEFLDSYTFMAIPFFMLAGTLMERSGLMGQIFDFFEELLGWFKGGLGSACFVTAAVLAALTGSSVASASAMSVVAIPRMIEAGYSRRLASGVICSGGTLAGLIPPSVWMILFGVMTDTNVAALFFGGFMPGLLLTALLILVGIVLANKENVRVIPFDFRRTLRGLKSCIVAIGLPVVVLGGLYTGWFTPTEAGAAACAYAMAYGFISTKGKFVGQLWEATSTALKLTSMILFLLGGVGIFQIVAANEYWPQMIAEFAAGLGLTPAQFLFAYTGALLVLGCFLDGAAMVLLTTPIAFPIAEALGIDPLHLGIMIVVACQLGCITPPVGVNLFAISGITGIPIGEILRGTVPFFLVILFFMALLVYWPSLVTWLPNILFRPVVFGGV